MRTLRTSYLWVVSLVSCLTFLPLVLPPSALAEEPGASQSVKKSHKGKPAIARGKKSHKKKAKSPASIVMLTEEEAHASFDTFTLEWMDKLRRTEEFQRTQQIKIRESTEGFLAEYTGYLPHRYIIVKKTSSKDTPYVGILTYYQQTLRCTGKTREEAIRGPFQQTGTSQVSEIFRFTKGKWHY